MGECVDLEALLKINPCLITACFETISGIDFHGLQANGFRREMPQAAGGRVRRSNVRLDGSAGEKALADQWLMEPKFQGFDNPQDCAYFAISSAAIAR
jgi:hypothetical protein